MNAWAGQKTTLHLEQATPARTLLIVDDDEGPRRSLQLIFKDDYKVLLASSGAEALELARHNSIDAAILDIRMSGMSGIELLERLKAFDPSIEALMLTGYESVETIREALRLGACDYLSKPFQVENIRNSVAQAMERRSLSQEIAATQQKMGALQVELQQQSVREQITRNKGEIYASVLHDINGPLMVIAGYVQLIDMDLDSMRGFNEGGTELLRDHLRTMNRQVNHCIEISQRYLGFLRRKPSDQDVSSVNSALVDVQTLLKSHPSRKQNALQIEPLPGDPQVGINGADLIQIILNLTINAFQASSEAHTVKIRGEAMANGASLFPKEDIQNRIVFSPSFDAQGTFIKISVEDDGPGMPSAILPQIFQPFFTTKGADGTGLGLSIVRRLVDEAGGAIHVHSEPGRGTKFDIYLRSASRST